MKFAYPAIFKTDASGKVQVTFPDLEGCCAQGDSMDEALDNAKEAESNWISVELEDTFELPPQSHPEDIALEAGEIVRMVAVGIRLMEGYDE